MESAEPPDSSIIDPWDFDQFRLPAHPVSDLAVRKEPPRHRFGEAFLQGPIPFAWVAAACRLPGVGLHVALTVRFLRKRFRRGRDRRWNVGCIAKWLQVSPDSVRRGMYVAERAELVSVSRKPGCKILVADVTIVEPPDAETDPVRRPLRGPIPWVWLLPALRLPGPSLQVAMACWLQAGWDRSAGFELGLSDWSELGLSRFSAARGLASLELAGLVSVVRRPGCRPIVTLREIRSEPETSERTGSV
jgi:hypothetical protein